MLEQIRKKIEAMIPGTKLNIARAKKKMEKELQAQGCSRSHAQSIVSERFGKAIKID